MDELLSLKWKNHCSSFVQLLSTIRGKQMYTDVTLACSGKFYNVHRMILTACSDYFKEIFEHLDCNKPVIVLKDINNENLEALLDYMYLGEVNVKQSNLTSLIKAAEFLQIKGLAVADETVDFPKGVSSKRPSNSPSSNRKRKNNDANNTDTSNRSKIMRREETTSDDESNENNNENKDMSCKDDAIFIKEDTVFIKEEIEDSVLTDSLNIDQSETKISSSSNFTSTPSTSQVHESYLEEGTSVMSPHQETTDWQCNDDSSWNVPSQLEFGSVENANHSTLDESRRWRCEFCSKVYTTAANLRRHVRIHTGEKPYSCSFCSYTSSDKSNLKKHTILIHT